MDKEWAKGREEYKEERDNEIEMNGKKRKRKSKERKGDKER